MADRPLNYTTKIPAARTIGECSALLAEAGADMVATIYTARKPSGLSFRLFTAGGDRDFVMPVNIDGVWKLLQDATYPASMHKSGQVRTYLTREHAERVAWRVIRDWLEAQLALIAAGMASLDQVMLPYLQVESGSLYELVQERGRLAALGAGDA